MTAKRIFQVYHQESHTRLGASGYAYIEPGVWRFRVLASRNKRIVGGSQESFDSKSNAMRAARREAGLYPAGVAVVEVAS